MYMMGLLNFAIVQREGKTLCTILIGNLQERLRISDVSEKSQILACMNVTRILQELVWAI
jgi:hypothetical protein